MKQYTLMSKVNIGSYTYDLKYEPESLLKLQSILFVNHYTYSPIDVVLAEHVHNMLVKFGFMWYSHNELKETTKGRQIPTHYHLSTFIFNSKAFLDAVANILNHFYNLGFEKGSIDLKRKDFINALNKKTPNLANEFLKQKEWIDFVTFWRDEIIHRKSPLIVYRSPPDKTGNAPKDLTVKMTIEPVTLFDCEKEEQRLQKKYGKVEQDILEFCHDWIDKADKMLQMVCEDLYNYEQNKTKQNKIFTL